MRSISTMLYALLVTFVMGCGGPENPPPGPPVDHSLIDGEACSSSAACRGYLCLPDLFGYQDGYCSTPDCSADSDCHGDDATCLQFIDGTSGCFAGCDDGDDCRDGYACAERANSTICLPRKVDLPEATSSPAVSFAQSSETLGLDCQPQALETSESRATWRFGFELGTDATSFALVPIVMEGTVRPRVMTTPNATVDFDIYRHHNTRVEDLINPPRGDFGTYGMVAFDWPVLVPYAPEFENYVVAGGSYEVDVETDGASPCLYVVEGRPGTTISLDVYLVGVTGYDAASAGTDADFAEVLAATESFLSTAGIGIGEVQFRDAPTELAERFSIVRDLTDIDLLTATGAPRSSDLEGHMTIDVFIVDTILFNGRVALGISGSVPGAPGLHGNGANGLVFGASDIGVDNAVVGQTLAHELAHYLGLRHTTELIHGVGTDDETQFEELVGATDPIADTPECESVSRLNRNCPDYNNLMFPTVQNEPTPPTLSEGQRYVLSRSPLVR